MDASSRKSPINFLFLNYKIPVSQALSLTDTWLNQHPQESQSSLFDLLKSKQLLVKNDQLIDAPSLSQEEAVELAKTIQAGGWLKIKDRRYRLTVYRQCFIGEELVQYFIDQQNRTVEEAIALGQSLWKHGLIKHVCNDHEFVNDFLFYRFTN